MGLVPSYIEALRAYEPGLSTAEVQKRFGLRRVVKLASNENPLGVSPVAVTRMEEVMRSMHRYPDGGFALRQELAARFRTKVENVIVGAGSEGIMADIMRTFLTDQDEVLTTEAAFLGFQVLARSRGVAYRTVPYRDFRYDLPALARAITPRTKLIYLANPNNPTGTIFTRDEFEEFYGHVPEHVLIIVDEAYFEFAKDAPAFPDSMYYRFDNVITLRTFSKAYGLAGLRVGYGFAHEALIAYLLKIKLPFEPSGIAQAAALGALEDVEFVSRTVGENARGLRFLGEGLRGLGLRPVESHANFVMIPFESAADAATVFNELLRRGVIVRPLAATGLPHCLRISVGSPDENEFAMEALKEHYVTHCVAAN
jgi:histidinol-phosphate aminotransferase